MSQPKIIPVSSSNEAVGYFLSNVDQYAWNAGVASGSYFTVFVDSICEGFTGTGVACRSLKPWEPADQSTIGSWTQAPPRFVITFNLLPQLAFGDRSQLLDILPSRIVCLLLDHPVHVLDVILTYKRYREFQYGVVDPLHVPFLRQLGLDARRIFVFQPAGPPPDAEIKDFSERTFDVVFAGGVGEIQDDDAFAASHADGDPKIGGALLRAVDRVLEDRDEDVFAAVWACLVDAGVVGEFPIVRLATLVRAVDWQARAIRRHRLFQSLADLDIHFFGNFTPAFRRANPKGIFHEPVSFVQLIDVMRNARIIANDTINFRWAGPTRFFYAVACGGLAASEPNAFLRSEFGPSGGILMLDPRADAKTNGEAVRTCLHNGALWRRKVDAAMATLRARHTWRHRAPALVAALG